MKASEKNIGLLKERKVEQKKSEESKFELIGCPINGIHCSSILKEINELYASAELYRINKEYQQSVKLLQKAYSKTYLLKEAECSACVDLFQENITRTIELNHKEAYNISVGFMHKKRYGLMVKKITTYVKNFKFA